MASQLAKSIMAGMIAKAKAGRKSVQQVAKVEDVEVKKWTIHFTPARVSLRASRKNGY
jgi:hypothetical protein